MNNASRLIGKTIEPAGNPGGTIIEGTSLDLRTLNPVLMNDEPSFSMGFMILSPRTSRTTLPLSVVTPARNCGMPPSFTSWRAT